LPGIRTVRYALIDDATDQNTLKESLQGVENMSQIYTNSKLTTLLSNYWKRLTNLCEVHYYGHKIVDIRKPGSPGLFAKFTNMLTAINVDKHLAPLIAQFVASYGWSQEHSFMSLPWTVSDGPYGICRTKILHPHTLGNEAQMIRDKFENMRKEDIHSEYRKWQQRHTQLLGVDINKLNTINDTVMFPELHKDTLFNVVETDAWFRYVFNNVEL